MMGGPWFEVVGVPRCIWRIVIDIDITFCINIVDGYIWGGLMMVISRFVVGIKVCR